MRRNFGSAIRGTAFTLTVCGLLLISANGFAVGGACPSAAKYVNPSNPTGALVTLSSLGITSCYFISAAGADTNNGTSESTPWLHAPGMPNCTGTCASTTPAAGNGFIFRGGDTWHMGNSSASPYTGGAWIFSTSGSSGSPIYYGVDPSWYSGGAWARPIFTGDNPVCGPSNVGGNCSSGSISNYHVSQYYVSSCAYQISPSSGGSSNTILSMYSIHYNTVDNFELTGLCEQDKGGTEDDAYVRYGSAYAMTFLNLYIHGWTHVQFADVNGGSGCTASTVCFGVSIFEGGGNRTPDDVLRYVVIDGSDSDPIAAQACYCDFWDVAYSYIGDQSGVIVRYPHLFHDNLYEYWYENGHGNVLESVGDAPGTNAVYNSVFRHINVPNDPGDPLIWSAPAVGTTDYFFNDLIYDVGTMEYFIAGQNNSDEGTLILFNDTFQSNSAPNGISCSATGNSSTLTLANMNFISDGTFISPTGNCAPWLTANTTPLTMTNAQATTDGYTSSQTYAYSPTSGSSPTVGAGTNEGTQNSAFCSALSTGAASDPTLSDAATACLSETRYACTYNTSNHTITCPARTAVARPSSGAWDVGAYQYGGSTAPAPPTALPPIAH